MHSSLLAHAEGGHGWGGPFEPWKIHPALIHLPIAFLLGGVAFDLHAWWRGRAYLVRIGTGMLIVGLPGGLLAALAGVLAYFTVPGHTEEAHRLMYWHLGIQTAAIVLFIWPVWQRRRNRTPMSTVTARLVACLAAFLLLIGSGIGGYLVYHGAGVAPKLLAAELRGGHSHLGGDEPPKEGHKHSEQSPQLHESQYCGPTGPMSRKEVPRPSAHRKPAHRRSFHESRTRTPLPLRSRRATGLRSSLQILLTRPASLSTTPARCTSPRADSITATTSFLRVLRISAKGESEVVVDQLNGPVTDLLWHDKRLYISHRGKISALEGGRLRDLVTGLPSLGDHHNNQLAVGPDGKVSRRA